MYLQHYEYTPQVGCVDGYKVVERLYNPYHKYKNINHYRHDASIGITEYDGYKNSKCLKNQYWWWPGFSLNPSLFNFKKISNLLVNLY